MAKAAVSFLAAVGNTTRRFKSFPSPPIFVDLRLIQSDLQTPHEEGKMEKSEEIMPEIRRRR